MRANQAAPVLPGAILSGIGNADRELIATYIALLAAGDGIAVMKGAVKDLGTRLKLVEDDAAAQLRGRVQRARTRFPARD